MFRHLFCQCFWNVCASNLPPLLTPFRHQCWCCWVLGFYMILWWHVCTTFLRICDPKWNPMNQPRGYLGLRPPLLQKKIIAFRRRHRSKDFCIIDSAQFLDRFSDDVLIKGLYNCAVAEARLAALKTERERYIYTYIYIYIYNFIYTVLVDTWQIEDRRQLNSLPSTQRLIPSGQLMSWACCERERTESWHTTWL